jgi:hypothetical protein
MNPQHLLIQWTFDALRLIGSEEVAVQVRRPAENVLEGSLSSVLNIDDTRQGVRKFVVLALDKPGEAVDYSDVERFCLEYSSQVGVLEAFLLSNGEPNESARSLLAEHRVTFVAITGTDEYRPPTAETVAPVSQLLLGARSVNNIMARLEEIAGLAATAEHAQSDEDLLHSAYLTLLALYHSEVELFAEGRAGRTTASISQSGAESAMVGDYAVQSYPLNGRRRSVFLPDLSDLNRALSLAVTAYDLSLRLERAGNHEPLAQMVGRISRQFLSYYLSWIDGRCHDLPHTILRDELDRFVGAPHISILSSHLDDFTPPEQIGFLSLLRGLRARAATDDLLHALDSMAPKVQELCLQTLADLGTVDDVRRIEPFILSRRESLRDAALRLIGNMGGDSAADYLIQLINTQRVPLSESVLKAIASTRSVLALGSLVQFGAGRKETELPVLDAVESCLDALDRDVLRRVGARYVSREVLERYVAFLFDAETDSAKRLALKLIATFQLAGGLDYVERALVDESLVTRLNAIRVVPLFPADRLVEAMAESLADLPEDYENRKLRAWLSASMSRPGKGSADRIDSVADLDLRAAVMAALTEADTHLADVYLLQFNAAAPVADSDGQPHEEKIDWRNMPALNSIFKCSDGLTIWVAHTTRERGADDMAFATLIHGNRFGGSLGVGEAASMLSGGTSMTQGTETEIFEGVVFPCLRGDEPRFPITIGMGESVMTKIEAGRTVISTRGNLHDSVGVDGQE